jgi:hypothetical protein
MKATPELIAKAEKAYWLTYGYSYPQYPNRTKGIAAAIESIPEPPEVADLRAQIAELTRINEQITADAKQLQVLAAAKRKEELEFMAAPMEWHVREVNEDLQRRLRTLVPPPDAATTAERISEKLSPQWHILPKVVQVVLDALKELEAEQ